MRLTQPFLKLPIRFDPAVLASEVRALSPSDWVPHPTGFAGNAAVRLVTPGGQESDGLDGAMAATAALRQCPYVRQVMAAIDAVWGRSRLMALAAGADVPPHIDTHHYWRTHLRIHIPIITNPDVSFTCGNESVHMASGECWLFDSFRWHHVENRGREERIHLVLDTVGGGSLPGLMRSARSGGPISFVPSKASERSALQFETVNSPSVMSPWEMRCHLAFLRSEGRADRGLDAIFDRMEDFIDSWAALWARYECHPSGRSHYAAVLAAARDETERLGSRALQLPNELALHRVLEQMIFEMALSRPAVPPAAAAAA